MANELIITDVGIAEVVNAEHTGTAPVVLSSVGFGSGQYTPTASQTALQIPIKSLNTVSGGSVGDNVIHVTVSDVSADTYTVYEIGVFTASGTLFAVYSQTTPIIQKAAYSEVLLAIDLVLTSVNPESVTIGDTNFILSPATTTKQGIVELATNDEAQTGSDATRAVTPAALASVVATISQRGLIQLATLAEVTAGTDAVKAVTPSTFLGTFTGRKSKTGWQKLPSGVIIQWGLCRSDADDDAPVAIVYPTAFPTECAYAGAQSLTDGVTVNVYDVTAANFKVRSNTDGNPKCYWVAVGY